MGRLRRQVERHAPPPSRGPAGPTAAPPCCSSTTPEPKSQLSSTPCCTESPPRGRVADVQVLRSHQALAGGRPGCRVPPVGPRHGRLLPQLLPAGPLARPGLDRLQPDLEVRQRGVPQSLLLPAVVPPLVLVLQIRWLSVLRLDWLRRPACHPNREHTRMSDIFREAISESAACTADPGWFSILRLEWLLGVVPSAASSIRNRSAHPGCQPSGCPAGRPSPASTRRTTPRSRSGLPKPMLSRSQS